MSGWGQDDSSTSAPGGRRARSAAAAIADGDRDAIAKKLDEDMDKICITQRSNKTTAAAHEGGGGLQPVARHRTFTEWTTLVGGVHVLLYTTAQPPPSNFINDQTMKQNHIWVVGRPIPHLTVSEREEFTVRDRESVAATHTHPLERHHTADPYTFSVSYVSCCATLVADEEALPSLLQA